MPLEKSRGIFSEIERDIPYCTANARNKLCLGFGRYLVVHAAHHTNIPRERMVYLLNLS